MSRTECPALWLTPFWYDLIKLWVLSSCTFIGSTRSGSYSEGVKSPKQRQRPRNSDPKDISLWAVSFKNYHFISLNHLFSNFKSTYQFHLIVKFTYQISFIYQFKLPINFNFNYLSISFTYQLYLSNLPIKFTYQFHLPSNFKFDHLTIISFNRLFSNFKFTLKSWHLPWILNNTHRACWKDISMKGQ